MNPVAVTIAIILMGVALYVLAGMATVYCWQKVYLPARFDLYTFGALALFWLWPILIVWFGPLWLIYRFNRIRMCSYGLGGRKWLAAPLAKNTQAESEPPGNVTQISSSGG